MMPQRPLRAGRRGRTGEVTGAPAAVVAGRRRLEVGAPGGAKTPVEALAKNARGNYLEMVTASPEAVDFVEAAEGFLCLSSNCRFVLTWLSTAYKRRELNDRR
jgi:hypothetical protein